MFRPALVSKNILVMMEATWSVEGRLTHHQQIQHRCMICHSSLHRRGGRYCIDSRPTFIDVFLRDNQELLLSRRSSRTRRSQLRLRCLDHEVHYLAQVLRRTVWFPKLAWALYPSHWLFTLHSECYMKIDNYPADNRHCHRKSCAYTHLYRYILTAIPQTLTKYTLNDKYFF